MLSALRSRVFQSSSSSSSGIQSWKLGFNRLISSSPSPSSSYDESSGYLELEEVEKTLIDVKADNIKVIPVKDQCDWTDFMVIATGRSTWHVRNIAEALIYKVKKKQEGFERLLLPSVQGQEGGKWIVIDSGKIVVHALDEKAREYYNLEGLYTKEALAKRVPDQDLDGAFVKVRPINNSKKKKPVQKTAESGFVSFIS
ncbi:protein Iojap-related, mitochondrial-like [Papaver somniferum]|uniref:protein Iojap-related, mitochondrial-like n=1 Tax=Papaver somniferum TaxID=3469 RepID=UPI000E6FA707|nr:protein Iojap-related, mitochondrial-like [Papaver somniferum]